MTEQLMPYGDYTLTERVRKTPIFGGLATQKKPKKNEKKNSPKFEICGSVRFFVVLFRFFSV